MEPTSPAERAVIPMIEVTAAALATHPFLPGMPPEQLAVLTGAASDVRFPAGRGALRVLPGSGLPAHREAGAGDRGPPAGHQSQVAQCAGSVLVTGSPSCAARVQSSSTWTTRLPARSRTD